MLVDIRFSYTSSDLLESIDHHSLVGLGRYDAATGHHSIINNHCMIELFFHDGLRDVCDLLLQISDLNLHFVDACVVRSIEALLYFILVHHFDVIEDQQSTSTRLFQEGRTASSFVKETTSFFKEVTAAFT